LSKLFYRAVIATWLTCAAQITAVAQREDQNFASQDSPCDRYADLSRYKLGDMGVKLDVSEPWAAAFRQALQYWNRVLNANLHEENNSNACAIKILYGGPEILGPPTPENTLLALAQIPDRPNFHGKIAVENDQAASSLSPAERFLTAVHELGHLFGLDHNASIQSVMVADDFASTQSLDQQDLKALGKKHQLRVSGLEPILASWSEPIGGDRSKLPKVVNVKAAILALIRALVQSYRVSDKDRDGIRGLPRRWVQGSAIRSGNHRLMRSLVFGLGRNQGGTPGRARAHDDSALGAALWAGMREAPRTSRRKGTEGRPTNLNVSISSELTRTTQYCQDLPSSNTPKYTHDGYQKAGTATLIRRRTWSASNGAYRASQSRTVS
jgi:hypothetical protein